MFTLRFSLFALFLSLAPVAFAEEPELYPLEPANTASPRDTLRSFITNCNDIYQMILDHERGRIRHTAEEQQATQERIFGCLDLSEVPEFMRRQRAAEAAVCLKEILDRIPFPPADTIPGPDEVAAAAEDGVAINHWRLPHTSIALYRVTEGPRQGEFLFMPETVAQAPKYYKRIKNLPYRNDLPNRAVSRNLYKWFLSTPGDAIAPLVETLPDRLRTSFWGHHAIWQWLGLTIVIIGGFAAMGIAYRLGRSRGKIFRGNSVIRYALTIGFPIIAMIVPLAVGWIVRNEIRISGATLTSVTFAANFIFLVAALFVISATGSRIAELIIASPKIHPKGLDAQLIRIVCRIGSIILSVIVFLEGGKYLGIPLTTLLASAGVGGIALALAAQEPIKNFLGSMMIILDKPYVVGERIAVKDYDGFVEEIGLRSTKLRLLSGHQVTIPNEEMARCDIENIGRRLHIRRDADLRLPFDIPAEKAERAVAIISELLENHEGFDAKYPPRVHLNKFNEDSLNLRMTYWYHPPEYWDFLSFCQKLNLEIKQRFNDEGIVFAPPTSLTRFATESHVRSSLEEDRLFHTLDEAESAGPASSRSAS